MNKIPCKDCITLPICRDRYLNGRERISSDFLKAYNGFSNVYRRCLIIDSYVRSSNTVFSTERVYELERFMIHE